MDKTTRYYFVISLSLKLLVSYFILTIILKVTDIYLYQFADIVEVLYIIFGYARTFLLLGFIAGIGYIVYAAYMYYSSKFYIVTKIPVSKALYFGYFDLAYVYERLKKADNEVEIDPTNKSLIVHTESNQYYVLVREYFGKIEGTERYDSWYIVKGKKKEYGRTEYRTKIPVSNPVFELRDLTNALEKKTKLKYQGYIVITGFTKLPFVSDTVLNVFQVEGLIE